ncbi:leucine-rich repeat flightless-interacting protein 1 isoform X16 [Hyla sarda]|uniref:leucine-rich repeat flightless-interacting protein 1 isoform X16 n=1 Tax=Hyla sarda TaxID=327740 RepID=UPI0024C32249|nr:leucine-rich repeat flightless-interacting protein 1 isoform X16 [Hyla sarda]
MGTQGPGRKRHPNRDKLSAEDHALNQIAREAEARLAAKRAARAEAREIRMKELERQQKEIYQVQKKYYGLDTKWGDIEQWMEDSERYSHRPRRNLQASDEDDVMSVTSRSSLRTNGYEDELLGATQYRKSSRSSTGSGDTIQSSRGPPRDESMSTYYSDLSMASAPLSAKSQQQSVLNGSRPSLLNCNSLPSRSQRGSLYDEGVTSSSRRSSSSRPPSEYSCYLGSGSRASSRASSARASPVIEERSDKDFTEKSGRPVSSLSAATLASLGGTSSRRGSGDTSISVDTEASIREIKDSLAEVEEKYKRSMVTNAQLDNEKTSLQYQVDTLREVLLELEEELAESRRHYEDKQKECERQKHEQGVLRFQLAEMKEALEQREALLTKHGITLDSDSTMNGDTPIEHHVNSDGPPDPPVRAVSMEIRLKKLMDERESFLEQIKKLKGQLDEKSLRNRSPENPDNENMENGTDVQNLCISTQLCRSREAVSPLLQDTFLTGDASRQINDLKFKLTKSTQEITALEQNIIRLESQLARYKTSSENSEKVEDELKAEKRRLQRELRAALDKIEELEVGNSHLVKRLEKMKANRSAILSQQ